MKKLLSKFGSYLLSALLVVAAVLLAPTVGFAAPGLWLVVLAAVLSAVFGGRQRCSGFLSWKPEYSVGIGAIDEQHIKLLNLINNLRAAVLCDTGPDFERGALEALIEYTQSHLKYEEDLMQAHDYFNLEAHKGQHDQMIIQVETYVQRYNECGNKILPEIADYLQLWLIQHIQVTDKKLCEFLQSNDMA